MEPTSPDGPGEDRRAAVPTPRVRLMRNGKRLTPKQIANRLDVCVATVYRWIQEGRLPAERRVGRSYLVLESDLALLFEPVSAPAGSNGSAAEKERLENELRKRGLL